MKRRSLRIIAVLLALISVIAIAAPSVFATGTTANAAFAMSSDVSSVRTKDIITLTVTLTNNSTKDISKIEFSLGYDGTRILGITPDYTTSINGMQKPNDQSPIVLRQDGSTIKIYNFDPSDSSVEPTPLKPGQKLELKFPMVVSEAAAAGSIVFSISDVSLKDSRSNAMTADICPNKTVTVLAPSSDATLSDFEAAVNNAPLTLTPAFAPNITEYTVTVGYAIPSFSIKATCTDDRATYTIIERPANDILAVGTNTYKYLVTAEDKTTTRIYTLTIKRLAAGETTTTTSPSTASTSTTTSTTQSTTTSTTASITTLSNSTTPPSTLPTVAAPVISASDAPAADKSGSTLTLNLATLLGIVASAVALFLLAFAAGYITHKNASQPHRYSVDELMAAQEKLEMQNRLAAQQNEPVYKSIFTPSPSEYTASYTPAPPAPAAPAYPMGGYGGYQPEAAPGYGYPQEAAPGYTGANMYSQGEFAPQPGEFSQQPGEYPGGYGMPEYGQPMDPAAAPTDFGADTHYYQ